MARVFSGMAIGTILVLLGAGFLGFLVDGHTYEAEHIGLSVFAALLTCLVHAATFTYFTATGRMIRQAVFIGHLDPEPSRQVADLKKSVSRCVASGTIPVVITVGLGAFIAGSRALSWLHLLLAITTIGVNVLAFVRLYELIGRNADLTSRVMTQYTQKRQSQAPAPQRS